MCHGLQDAWEAVLVRMLNDCVCTCREFISILPLSLIFLSVYFLRASSAYLCEFLNLWVVHLVVKEKGRQLRFCFLFLNSFSIRVRLLVKAFFAPTCFRVCKDKYFSE